MTQTTKPQPLLEGEGTTLDPDPEVEGSEMYAELMSQPPGPLKCRTRVRWHRRSPSGPVGDDGRRDPEALV